MADVLYDAAVEFAQARVGFTRRRFQECLRVGFVKRDVLLLQLVDNGVIEHASNNRDYFLTRDTPTDDEGGDTKAPPPVVRLTRNAPDGDGAEANRSAKARDEGGEGA